jgi:diguanylate cyclase (GGDEF)-like protein
LDGLRVELRRRDRGKTLLCIGLIDLDPFKRIDSNHGHAAGNRVLRRFAEAASRALPAQA